jgi:RHS repeat-associated protein
VIRTTTSSKPNLEFTYDASGNRIAKKVIQPNGNYSTTFYVRDASGNVMAVYKTSGTTNLTLEEQHIYGSSRLGIFKKDKTKKAGIKEGTVGARALGERQYELTDHLGNVRVVLIDYYKVGMSIDDRVLSATDYYPFGMVARSRTTKNNYRYGFNGKELDRDEEGMGGGGSTYDYGFRIYNPALARFLSVDPLAQLYPWYTPYQFAGNRPITCIDIDGLEPQDANGTNSSSDPNEITGWDNEVVITAARPLTGSEKFFTFAGAFIKSAVTAAVITAAVVLVVSTAGAAGPFIMAGAMAYGAYQLGEGGYELISGKEAWTGRKLSEEEKWEKAGSLAGGVVGGGLGAKGGIKIRNKLNAKSAKITEGVTQDSNSSPSTNQSQTPTPAEQTQQIEGTSGGGIPEPNLPPAPKASSSLTSMFNRGENVKATELIKFAEQEGWIRKQNENGPIKFIDENGVARLTIKEGSTRAPGSSSPHVEVRDANGKRIDPTTGQNTTRKGGGNHTEIEYDL